VLIPDDSLAWFRPLLALQDQILPEPDDSTRKMSRMLSM
jgi:hypothetical protein